MCRLSMLWGEKMFLQLGKTQPCIFLVLASYMQGLHLLVLGTWQVAPNTLIRMSLWKGFTHTHRLVIRRWRPYRDSPRFSGNKAQREVITNRSHRACGQNMAAGKVLGTRE